MNFVGVFSYTLALASLYFAPVAAGQTAMTCFTSTGPDNPFDAPFFTITYPEPQIALLHLNGANDGFHEAIGDMIALSMTPDYFVQIGLMPASAVRTMPRCTSSSYWNMVIHSI